jgi:hypothetical protein
LAAVRTEQRTGFGLEPIDDDLAVLVRALRCR